MPSAAEFSHMKMEFPTTLIVAPSPQVMGVWKSEIEKLVSDWKSYRLLQGIMWFRVVLDEAHWIRNTTSQQFKAAKDLQAQRRWCLSGTPIQNTLDDLRSLLDFLHFKPFSEPGFYRKHIIEPLHVASLDPFRNLRLLLRITCFRRTVELLCIPPHEIREIAISLTDTEAQLYGEILDRCKEEFEEILYMRSTKKRYTVLFAATMSLRRLCNHGTCIQRQYSSRLQTPKRQGKAAIRKKINNFSDEPMCAYCYGDDADISADMGALEVCPECSRVLDHGRAAPSPLNEGDDTLHVTSTNQPSTVSTFFNSAQVGDLGFSSKLKAVVDNIRSSPSSKHIVFTSWRLTLEILQRLLVRQGVPNSRIDGQTSFGEREVVLKQFSGEEGPDVLLLSIATGAVGYVNVRRFIDFTFWSGRLTGRKQLDSDEEQAIGRALKIGQQRNVVVYKYIAKQLTDMTKNIVFLQKRKSHLAKISFDGHAGSQEGEKLEDMLFLLQNGSAQQKASGGIIPPAPQHERHPLFGAPHGARNCVDHSGRRGELAEVGFERVD
ncbi:hypothetical protein PG994_004410 [Apiospora phragmitis]|uniref:Uncharacterized protein n=1 Tax=Apiospora phragmitis TaxID=2905665 RepID=A0ABR1VQI8_9PEZI